MQLGTRWAAGTNPPSSVPVELHAAIAEVETRSLSLSKGPVQPHWTLTWLEGRPIAEIDTGWEVLYDASGDVIARPWQD